LKYFVNDCKKCVDAPQDLRPVARAPLTTPLQEMACTASKFPFNCEELQVNLQHVENFVKLPAFSVYYNTRKRKLFVT